MKMMMVTVIKIISYQQQKKSFSITSVLFTNYKCYNNDSKKVLN